MILTKDQVEKLARLLVRCGRLTIQHKRDVIIDKLPHDISENIERAGSPKDDVFRIVMRCNEHPGGIEQLVRYVHSSGKKYKPMKDVWEYLASLFRPNDSLANNLLSRFLFFSSAADIKGQDVDSFYHSIPVPTQRLYHLSSPKKTGLWKFVFQLYDVPPQDGKQQPLLLSFLRALTQVIEDEKYRKEYYAWLVKIEERLGNAVTDTPNQTECGIGHQAPYILLDLQPKSTPDRQNYRATIYIWQGKPVSAPEEVFEGIETELAKQLDQWIADFFQEEAQPECIEVFLPRSRIFEIKPHLWPSCLDPNLISSRLGCDYPTVVRIDRVNRDAAPVRKKFRDDWVNKWGQFQSLASKISKMDGCSLWVEEEEVQNLGSLLNRCRASDAAPMMIAAFQPKLKTNQPGLAHVFLQSGIPVALWGDVDQEDMMKLLSMVCLKTLPVSLKELRLKVSENNFDAPVTLLWDDPQRELPDILHEPKKIQFTEDGLFGPP